MRRKINSYTCASKQMVLSLATGCEHKNEAKNVSKEMCYWGTDDMYLTTSGARQTLIAGKDSCNLSRISNRQEGTTVMRKVRIGQTVRATYQNMLFTLHPFNWLMHQIRAPRDYAFQARPKYKTHISWKFERSLCNSDPLIASSQKLPTLIPCLELILLMKYTPGQN